MILTVPRGLSKRIIYTFLTVLLLGIAYLRFYVGFESWTLSSGDRLLNTIKFCPLPPKYMYILRVLLIRFE